MKKIKYFFPNSNNTQIWITALLMLFGVLFFGWRPEIIIFAYIFETIVIGIIHIFKMLFTVRYSEKDKIERKHKKPNEISGYFSVLFFCVHYFFFIAVQSVFVFVFIGMNNSNYSSDITGIFGNFQYLFSQPDMREAFSIIIISNVFYAFKTFFLPKKYLESSVKELFFQPYVRIFVQQFVAILGGFIFMILGGAKGIAVLVIVLKTIVDLIGISIRSNPVFKEKAVNFIFDSKKYKNESPEEIEKQKKIFEKMFE